MLHTARLSSKAFQLGRLPQIVLLALLTGCPGLPEVLPFIDDAAHLDSGRRDVNGADWRGSSDHGREDSTEPACGPDMPNYGEPCGECGLYVCDMEDQLICYDPGLNACNVCGELDETAGKLTENCGTCGVVTCQTDGLATECTGEHEPNACGGCTPISEDKGPPETGCSSCGTGIWRCTADNSDLMCFRGRGLTACGGCRRCVLYHAEMDQRMGGAFIKTGTLALVEDTGTDSDVGSDVAGGTNRSLVFDPLVAGPGASGLALSYVILSPTMDPEDVGSMMLFPEFAVSQDSKPADEVRRYTLYSWMSLETYQYVLIYDYFFEDLISAGRFVPGPPDNLLDNDAGYADVGIEDAAPEDVAPEDAAAEDASAEDTSLHDARAEDAALEDRPPEDRRLSDIDTTDARAEDRSLNDTTLEDSR